MSTFGNSILKTININTNRFYTFFKSPIGKLLLIGFVVRVCLFFMYQPYNHLDEVIIADAKEYHSLALNLINHGNFLIPNSTVDTIRTPIYPLLLALFYSIFGVNTSIVILFQQLLSLVSVFLLYKIGEQIFNKKTGFIAAVLLCFEPEHIYYSYSLLTESLFVFLLLSATLLFIRFLKENNLNLLIISSFLIGLATLTRPISQFIPIVGIFILSIYAIKHKEKWLKVAVSSSLFLMVFILTISPWSIRNKIQYDSYSLSALGGKFLLVDNVAFTIKHKSNKSINEIRDDLYQNEVLRNGDSTKLATNRFYLSSIQTKVALEYMKDNKWEYMKANAIGIFNQYSALGYKDFLNRFVRVEKRRGYDDKYDIVSASWSRFKSMSPLYLFAAILNLVYMLIIYGLSCVGLFSLIKDKKYVLILSLLSIIGYFTALIGVVGLARYKLPISIYYILFATTGLLFLVDKMKRLPKKNEVAFD